MLYHAEQNLQFAEMQDKREGNCVIESSTKSDTEMEYFSENDNSNLESEYFATISPSVITRQPYPQMNFFKNAKISNLINDQTTTTTDDSSNGIIFIALHIVVIYFA